MPLRGTYALAWSGGKDSAHALHRAERQGYGVSRLFTIYEAVTNRVRFHGVPRELIAEQAGALELGLVEEASGEGGFEAAFGRVLDRLQALNIQGVIFGNIHLQEIRAWYEERTSARGLEHVEPLWARDPARLVRQYCALGYRSLVVSVDLKLGDPRWLGRELTPTLVNRMVARGLDPCGERGEYHTFAWTGPRFRRPVGYRVVGELEREGHRFLDLTGDGDEEGR